MAKSHRDFERRAVLDMAELLRRHLIFHGSVQGVGFRYRARHAARLYGCTGWCRNLPDGSVEMEIQGTEASIDRVLMAIQAGRYVQIDRLECRGLPLLERESGFGTD